MGVALERGVALGPGGIGDEQRYGTNRRYVAETGCSWVRLWAEWPKLQPRPDEPPDFGSLDEEIAAARADGLKVMLTAWRYPRWANGTADLTRDEDARFELSDRLKPGADPARRKDLTFRPPDDLGPDSPFGRWLSALGRRDADAIEVVNEPNLQLWPQTDVHVPAARMIATAREVIGDARTIVGPAASDRVGTNHLSTDHEDFARALIAELDRVGARPDAWSHHTYGDVENDTGERLAAAARPVRRRWPDMPIYVTESGARLTAIARKERLRDDVVVRRRQAELIARGHDRLRAGADTVELVLQYLFITDMNYDSGLCELDGTPRPSYFAWAALP